MTKKKSRTGKTGQRVGNKYVVSGPFDTHLELMNASAVPEHWRNAAVLMNDTLDTAWASVRQVFGDEAQPEHALTLLPMLLEEMRRKPDDE